MSILPAHDDQTPHSVARNPHFPKAFYEIIILYIGTLFAYTIEQEEHKMNFMEAYELMKQGKILQRNSAPGVLFRCIGAVIQATISGNPEYPWTTAYTLCCLFDATDWEVVE